MSEAFNIKMVRECYYMMQLMEQQDFTFTQDDKRLLFRVCISSAGFGLCA